MNQKSKEVEELEAKVSALEAQKVELEDSLAEKAEEVIRLTRGYNKERSEKIAALTRIQKVETATRVLTMDQLMVRFHEIDPKTPILWITTPNTSVVNAGTFANINDRLKRLCPKLDLVILTAGDFDATQMTDAELAKMGLFRLPNTRECELNKESTPYSLSKPVLDRLLTSSLEFQKTTQGNGGEDFAW